MAHPWKSLPFFTCCGSEVRKIRVSGFGSWQAKLLVESNKQAPRQAKELVRMCVCEGDSSHKPISPFHAISEVPWIVRIATVILVGVNRGVDNTHNHKSTLEAS